MILQNSNLRCTLYIRQPVKFMVVIGLILLFLSCIQSALALLTLPTLQIENFKKNWKSKF